MWKALAVIVALGLLLCTCGGVGAGVYYWTQAEEGMPAVAPTPTTGGTATEADEAVATPDAPITKAAALADSEAFRKGKDAYSASRYDEALTLFDAAVREAPADPMPLSWRGRTYARLERLDRAEADLDDASARLPGDLETWRALGWVRDRKGDDYEALAAWNHAVELAPTDSKIKLSRANTNFKLGKRLAAVDDATAACDLGLTEGCVLRDRLHGGP